jgi:hypothetical protein
MVCLLTKLIFLEKKVIFCLRLIKKSLPLRPLLKKKKYEYFE